MSRWTPPSPPRVGGPQSPEGLASPGDLRVLIVDDEPDVLLGLRLLVESIGTQVRTAVNGVEALRTIRRDPPHLVISDISMEGLTGLELLDTLRREHPEIRVLLITGFGTIDQAVSAMQRGAAHFITKPFDNQDIVDAVHQFGRLALVEEDIRKRSGIAPGSSPSLVAEAPRMRDVLSLLARVAPTSMTVLIQGESGTGKELIARSLHERGAAPDRPFLAVNTAALPDTLLESELFGHRKGAFTGADRDRQGIFEQARGGTVFLDEIGLMSPAFQGKLLRVVQDRTVIPLGTSEARPVDFRLVAATSRDLRGRVAEGAFREDLLYRLEVVTIDIPPLRERTEDILPLAAHFLARYAPQVRKPGSPLPSFSAGAIEAMRSARWPGNARELENSIQRALVLSDGDVLHAYQLGLEGHSGPWPGSPGSAVSYDEAKQEAVRRFQIQYVERALARSGGNVSRAAETCNLSRAAFQRILRGLRVDRTDFQAPPIP